MSGNLGEGRGNTTVQRTPVHALEGVPLEVDEKRMEFGNVSFGDGILKLWSSFEDLKGVVC